MFAIGLVLQARGYFIYRSKGVNCDDDTYHEAETYGNAYMCANSTDYLMLRSTGSGNSEAQVDSANLMISKYGFGKDDFLLGPTQCFDANGGKQLVDPSDSALPLDRKTQCLFNLLVCDASTDPSQSLGIVDYCKSIWIKYIDI